MNLTGEMFKFRFDGSSRLVSDWVDLGDLPDGAVVVKANEEVVARTDMEGHEGVKNGLCLRCFILPANDTSVWVYVQAFPRNITTLKV